LLSPGHLPGGCTGATEGRRRDRCVCNRFSEAVNRAAISPNIGAIAVHIVTNGMLTGATDNIDRGQQLVSA
jgi:hypothetical protein